MEYEILKPPPRRHRLAWLVALVVVVAAVATGAFVFGRHDSATSPGRATTTSHPSSVAPARQLAVVATVPATGATDVPSNQVVTVTLSDPVATVTAAPTFNPIVAGTWKKTATDTLTFAAQPPSYRRDRDPTIPPGGLRATSGATLGTPTT